MSEYRKPYPIPVEEDYSVAAEFTDALFQEHGSAWTYYYKTSLIEAHHNNSTRELFQVIASHARLIEPIEDDTLKPFDPLFRATHAFGAGMWTGGLMAQQLYGELMSNGAIYNSIAQSLPHSAYDGREEYEEDGRFLMTIGHEGLKYAGYEVRTQLERWGDDIVSDENVRRYYSLGAGAVFCTTRAIYSSLYETLQVNYQAAQLTDEVSQYLANITDSSGN